MNNFLAGIKTIGYAYPENLDIKSKEIVLSGSQVTIDGVFNDIEIEGLASLEYTSKRVGNQVVYTTEVTFKAGCQAWFPWNLEQLILNKNLVYRLTDVYNKKWLLGTAETPYPVVSVRYDNPSNPASANISEYTITYTNLFPILEII
jgi:hypothetical protein